MTRILLLEDDAILSKVVQNFLISRNFECDAVFDGEVFFRQLRQQQYNLFLLDINVPKMNGLDVCSQIRETDKSTPILMLTAYGDVQDKRDAFDKGADDYLVKPFHIDELFMRIQSLLRRSSIPQQQDEIISVSDLEINTTSATVKRDGQEITLTQKEYQLLLLLAKSKGRVLSKAAISEQLWDNQFDTNLNTIEVYINYIRKKIDRDFSTKLIHTRLGFGYYLKEE
ncbi:response regulator transcription factor [Flavobacterium silvaticum]|uniref:Response regulator transcription factor n=1 Tax=Flavobacterium silvaticum TaxID=1852020 RepID=A0A972JHH9_9FLAO|nr:response regulator transcription factor [Flavobacterium silvaticum]NMH27945.1 response regulator transcription factor [Flavobacterium silvaticum]